MHRMARSGYKSFYRWDMEGGEMNQPSLLIEFNPDTWTPTAVFPNAQTDKEAAKLKVIADEIIKAVKGVSIVRP